MLFTERFNEAIKNSHKSQKDIAISCEIHPSCITQYKKGDTQPTLDVLYKLCIALEVTSDYLLGLSDF